MLGRGGIACTYHYFGDLRTESVQHSYPTLSATVLEFDSTFTHERAPLVLLAVCRGLHAALLLYRYFPAFDAAIFDDDFE